MAAPKAGKAPETPNSACFFLGINTVPYVTEAVLKVVVGAGAPVPGLIGPKDAKPEKPPMPAGFCY